MHAGKASFLESEERGGSEGGTTSPVVQRGEACAWLPGSECAEGREGKAVGSWRERRRKRPRKWGTLRGGEVVRHGEGYSGERKWNTRLF